MLVRQLLALLLFASFLRLAAAGSSTSALRPSCWAKACGDLNISYPFWLEGPGEPPCGPPSFQLSCNGGGAYLQSRSPTQSHRVASIFAANSSFRVVDESLPLATGCPAPPRYNASADIVGLDQFFVSSANAGTLLFLSRCREPLPAAVPPGFRRLPCDNRSFVAGVGAGGHRLQGQPPSGCLLSAVPTLRPPAPGGDDEDYVASLRNGFLMEWKPLVGDYCSRCNASGGMCMYGVDGQWDGCDCHDDSQGHPRSCDDMGRKHNIKLVLIVSLSASASLILTSLVWIMYCRKGKHSLLTGKCTGGESNIEQMLEGYGSLVPRQYRYSELKKMTGCFKDKLGEGGYGMVYKGSLDDGREVAVKLLKGSKGNGEEFLNEVISIRSTSHVNIVSLIGFCLHGSKRALVYEYMANGSLEKYIYSEENKMAIGWEKLRQIAIGIARGLEYLHRGCNTRIIHFDIKPHNMLLNQDFCPKIADFGLAKLCHLKDSVISMAEARGTIGYIAPEVFSRGFGVVSTKSDVYSYGMMLLEMVGGRGRNNVRENTGNSSAAYFPNWIYDRLVEDLQRQEVTSEQTEEIARQMTLVAFWCIQTNPGNRPSMTRVIEMLEKNITELEMPPKPYLSCPSLPSNFSS